MVYILIGCAPNLLYLFSCLMKSSIYQKKKDKKPYSQFILKKLIPGLELANCHNIKLLSSKWLDRE